MATSTARLAWDLMGNCRSQLTEAEIVDAFLNIGCDNDLAAIDLVLTAVIRAVATVPPQLSERLANLATGYQGHEAWQRLTMLVHLSCRASIRDAGFTRPYAFWE